MRASSQDEQEQRSQLISSLEEKILLLEQTLDMSKQKQEKDLAIYQQKNEFLELQVREERSRNDEQRLQHEQMLRNL